ncbi:MAG TPA: hypothetical protein VLF43_00465 [Candidatus Saccharimonadales bacterium]|nr:hypothetical protein [Candidatus Saccharimonadales bacterium]
MDVAFFAHAFGQRYDLPLPLWLYIYGGAAAVVVSFAVVGYFLDKKRITASKLRLLGTVPQWVRAMLAAVSLVLFSFVVLTGLVGSQVAVENLNVTIFWIIFLLGFTYITLLAGNWWPYIRPSSTIVSLLERLAGTPFGPIAQYPKWLGYYPALLTYGGLIWLELLSSGYGVVPQNLSWILLGYTAVSAAGQIIFGRDWYRYGDLFSVFFKIVGKIAPPTIKQGKLYARTPFAGLLQQQTWRPGIVLFVLFMLSSTAFDGLRDTKVFARITTVPHDLFLIIIPCVFLVLYGLCMAIMRALSRTKLSVMQLAATFSLSIVPIAVAYNIAHYWTLLLVQGQRIVALMSDPFGWNWDSFGTAGHKIDVGIVGAGTVWYSQVTIIVLGHIAAVYIAHRIALNLYPTTKQALTSQYPMLLLMVVYTMASLWIIAQPIIAS